MDKSLLDTDILSEITKGVNANVMAKAIAYRTAFGHYTLSVLSVLETIKGYHRVRRPDRIAQFRSSLIGEEILTLDVTTADLAGHIFADLELAGQPIGRMDPMIAAIAIENGLTLVTGNTAHYARISALGYALTLDNWRI
jgi:tRNA(fMet)-specific endonuclease VapC